MDVVLCVSAIENMFEARVWWDQIFGYKIPRKSKILKPEKKKEKRNLMVTSLLSLYGPSPVGTAGSSQAARGLECWDKGPKTIFFSIQTTF